MLIIIQPNSHSLQTKWTYLIVCIQRAHYLLKFQHAPTGIFSRRAPKFFWRTITIKKYSHTPVKTIRLSPPECGWFFLCPGSDVFWYKFHFQGTANFRVNVWLNWSENPPHYLLSSWFRFPTYSICKPWLGFALPTTNHVNLNHDGTFHPPRVGLRIRLWWITSHFLSIYLEWKIDLS